ncbi:MAG: hypothetical protein N4A50_06305 [Vallitalea sp.]|jgi:hypothetical protein|nr:hypothetical protein [Vallitalea sp.]
MINKLYVEKLLRLIKIGLIDVEEIKNEEYKTEIKKRISAS